MLDVDSSSPAKPPRTLTVLGLLALTALTFSYLGAYAVTNALVANQVMSPIATVRDPRPRWLLTSFCVLMLIFMAIGAAVRRLSRRDFAAIDQMVEADDQTPFSSE